MPSFPSFRNLDDLQEKVSAALKPWDRSFQFWVRAADVYTGYKVCQLRAMLFVKDKEKQEAMWERQHELAAEKVYSLCTDLGGLFLKFAQIVGKPDLAPAAWVRRLVTLCDKAPATPFPVVRHILEEELGGKLSDIFERFDVEPVGSASIAQVHRARLRSAKNDVAVKVQHPGVQFLMTVDIRNLQAFVLFLQKIDIKFDLFSLTKEVEKQSFPEELFSVLRTIQLLRGLSVGLGINYSCAEQWRPIAEEALYKAGRLKRRGSESTQAWVSQKNIPKKGE